MKFALALVLALPVFPAEAEQRIQCGTSLNGQIGAGGYYGGHGEISCPPPSTEGAADGGTYVIREVRPEPSLCAGTPDARLEVIRVFDSNASQISVSSRCVGPNVPGDPVPPPPPAPEEALRQAPLPAPGVRTSPPGRGLVGFPTHLWWDAETDLPPISVTVGEWSATVTPRLVGITWDMGNGDVVEGDGPGSEDDPSAVYTYRRRCDCTITMTATWGGTVSFSHPLLPAPIVVEAGAVPFTASATYGVVEREAVVVG